MALFRDRIDRTRKTMVQKGVDTLVIGPESNMFYLTGFREEQMERPLLLIIREDTERIIAPKIYEEQLSTLGIEGVFYRDGEDPFAGTNISGRTAVDDRLFSSVLIQILKKYSLREIVPSSYVMREVRSVKDDREVEVMSQGVRLTEKALEEAVKEIRTGITERDFSKLLVSKMEEVGLEGKSFEPIVGSGPNSSKPHYRSGDRVIVNGDALVVDFGGLYKGYSTDMTRTFSVGRASKEFREVYRIVMEGQDLGERALSAGVSASDVDAISRNYIERSGYGKFFIHRLGHGIGIDVHEDPYLSPDNGEPLRAGNVVTVEPGVYIPQRYGVRIEDMAVVKEKGGKVLNSFTKEIIEV